MFPLVSYTNETCGWFLDRFIRKFSEEILAVRLYTDCHKKNLCSLQLLHASILLKVQCRSVSLGNLYHRLVSRSQTFSFTLGREEKGLVNIVQLSHNRT